MDEELDYRGGDTSMEEKNVSRRSFLKKAILGAGIGIMGLMPTSGLKITENAIWRNGKQELKESWKIKASNYSTLQEAVNDLEEGQTLIIPNSQTYDEDITVSTRGVCIKGTGGIAWSGSIISGTVTLSDQRIELSNVHISPGTGKDGVVVSNRMCRIEKCTFGEADTALNIDAQETDVLMNKFRPHDHNTSINITSNGTSCMIDSNGVFSTGQNISITDNGTGNSIGDNI